MIVELVNTGSELLLGRTLNTHQQWLCRQLTDRGYLVTRQVAIPDTGHDIQQAVRESLGRADLVIVTGGLGPTSDDITRDLIAALLDRPLQEDPAIVASLKAFFARRNRPMPPANLVQAQVPEGALVLPNPNGTAPGLAMQVSPNAFRAGGKSSWLIMLPGPPRELRPMFTDAVVPLLQRELTPIQFVCHTLRTTDLGESALQEQIAGPLQTLVNAGLELGYCARPGAVDVRLAARGAAAEKLVADAKAVVTRLLAKSIYAEDDDELETVIVRELTARRQTLALAESCTGGCIAHRITNVPGASAVLIAGLVTYANAAKEKFLGVRPDTLAAHGAVSEAVCREMAEGARRETGADFAIAVTGIAGPSGGSPEKPVGTVFIGVSSARGTIVLQQLNRYEREAFKQMTAQQALDLLRRQIAT
ncbi:MAG TPA: competence/damage-inducible protein A [Verrucomicrobiae bacterium]|nr:competence/damage-inducible protein A [Verrucomicrobiae bacterium]